MSSGTSAQNLAIEKDFVMSADLQYQELFNNCKKQWEGKVVVFSCKNSSRKANVVCQSVSQCVTITTSF